MMGKIKLALITAACIIAFGAVTYAEDISCSVDNGTYLISGSAESLNVSFVIMPADDVPDELTVEKLNSGEYIGFSVTCSDGVYSKSFALPEDFHSGEYKTVIYDGSQAYERRFIYYSSALDELSDFLHNADSETRLRLIKENVDELGINLEDAEKFEAILTGIGDLKTNYKNAIVILKIKNGALDEAVEFYGADYGIDPESEYTQLKDSVKAELQSRLQLESITDLKAQYKDILSQVIFDKLENTTELKSLLKMLNADFSTFNALSSNNQSAVLNKTMNNLPQKVEDLVDLFERYSSEADGSGGSSSGGGNFGGGSGNISGGGTGSGGSSANGPEPGKNLIENNFIGNSQDTIFPDTLNHWSRDYIMDLYQKGIASGYDDGTFRPDNNISRAEFAKLIAEASQTAVADYDMEFSDVPKDAWYYGYVQTLSSRGIINGYDDGSFRPSELIKREDAALIIYRILDGITEFTETANFSDSDEISDYAVNAVEKLGGAGILTGSDGKINPKSNLTRAEAVTLISRMLQRM